MTKGDVTLRRATKADAKVLSQLAMRTYSEAFGGSFAAADLKAHLEKNLSEECFGRLLGEDAILLAEIANRMIGFIQIGAAKPEDYDEDIFPADRELRRLYVLRAFQNRGIGSQLMDRAFEEASFRRARCTYLDVWEDNFGAQRLYRAYGFEVSGRRAFKVESGAQTGFDLIMVRRNEPTLR